VGGRQLLYLMINDITERKRMEAELERSRRNLEVIVAQRTQDLLRANAELQQASTARDMVFVNLSQELRTSLQTITGFSDLLASGAPGTLNHEQHRQVEMIQQAGKRLAAFAATLMESRRLVESQTACESEEVDLVTLAESVLFGLAAFAEDKGLRLELVADERPLDVITDRYKLQQVMLNLLSNAIRYTDRGSVTVTVARDADGQRSVSVADTGPGLSAEQIETVFSGPEVHDSAAGIGLPTSRRIAAMLGGSITVTSEIDRGSVFTLRIPEECREFVRTLEE
jgi:signal transduction histidine kinase